MCGIAFSIGGKPDQEKIFAQRANCLLAHRGPDGEGIFSDDHVTMAHRRLAILDLSEAGAQPMYTNDKRYVIVHNGEVYNHLELRKKFLADYLFKGHSDTETLLALYERIGVEMLPYLVGMWAFAIWDTREQKILISRDRYGQKPLYWKRSSSGSLRFSSEIKPLLEENERPVMNVTAVAEYLALGNYGHLGTQTFFRDVSHFPQAHYAIISSDELNINAKPYWNLPLVNPKDKIPLDDKRKSKLRGVIEEAVSSQLLSDVVVGATLSGGIDSSVTVGLMAKHLNKGFPVFTAQTSGSKWDESVYVKAVEEKWGKENVQLQWKELTNTQLSLSLPKYITIQEEPFGDPSIMAHGFLMGMAKDAGVKVVLGGQGSDELFFGYGNMTSALLAQGFRKGSFNWFYNNVRNMNLSSVQKIRVLTTAILPTLEKNMRLRSRGNRRGFIHSNILQRINDKEIHLANNKNFYEVWNESVNGVHLPHLVHYDDRNGMSCSIEGRMPFLDHRIAENIADLRIEDLLLDGKSKSILRETCFDIIPELIYNRKDKIGFYTPLPDMMKAEKKLIDDYIKEHLPANILAEGYKEYLDVPENYLIKFRVYSLCVWMNLFNVSVE